MGAVNLAVGRMMAQKDVFADFINGTYYNGRQVLHPERLSIITTHRGNTKEKINKSNTKELDGDIRMQADFGTYSIIFADENQTLTHYAMPLRCMEYDVEEYREQWKRIRDVHEKKHELHSSEELLSGLTRDDKFVPVVTSVLYTGAKWNGPTELHEMLEFGNGEDAEFWKQFIPNYKINLVNMSEFENPDVFKSCLRHIFNMVKYRNDKYMYDQYRTAHREELENMGIIGQEAMLSILGERTRVYRKIQESKEETGMCKAMDELIEDGRIEGKIEQMLELVSKKLSKGKSLDEIVNETESNLETIKPLVDFARGFAPQFDINEILYKWAMSRK